MSGRINPFNPNSVVTPTLFAGRHDQVFQILKKLTQVREGMPASFVLQGDRGIGKTALAKLIMYTAEAKNPHLENLKFLTSYYAVEKGQSFESVLQASLNIMTDRMPDSVIHRLSQRLGNFFKNGKFTFGAFGASATVEGEVKKEDKLTVIKDRAVSVFSNIISGIDELKDDPEQLDGILLVIDEVHNLKDLDGAAQILRAISTTLDVSRLGKISFMVLGYPDGMDRFFKGDPSARRHFDIIELTAMPRTDAKEVLIKGFSRANLTYDEQALEQNIDVAGGYPHSIQVIGHNLVEVDRDGKISADDWTAALMKSAAEMARKEFSDLYDFKGKGTLRETVLNVLALAQRPMTKQELRDAVGGKNIYTATCMGELKKSGAVTEIADGSIILHSMLFRAAVLIHLYTHADRNPAYQEQIQKFSPAHEDTTLTSSKEKSK
jgi:hypothetical protein